MAAPMATELPRVRARLPAALVGAVVGPDEVWLGESPVGSEPEPVVAVALEELVGAAVVWLVLEADLLVLVLVGLEDEDEDSPSSPSSEEPSVLTMMLSMVPDLSP